MHLTHSRLIWSLCLGLCTIQVTDFTIWGQASFTGGSVVPVDEVILSIFLRENLMFEGDRSHIPHKVLMSELTAPSCCSSYALAVSNAVGFGHHLWKRFNPKMPPALISISFREVRFGRQIHISFDDLHKPPAYIVPGSKALWTTTHDPHSTTYFRLYLPAVLGASPLISSQCLPIQTVPCSSSPAIVSKMTWTR